MTVSGLPEHELGHVIGRNLGELRPTNEVGRIAVLDGRPASEANVKAARGHFIEARAEEFLILDDGRWADGSSGRIYERVLSDPLFASQPRDHADVFVQTNGVIAFLRDAGTSLGELEAAELERERREAVEAEALAKWRAKQKMTPLRLSDLYGEERYPTLRRAAAEVAEAGGVIRRGAHGEVEVALPARLRPPGEPSDWSAGRLELETRRRLAVAAEVLVRGERAVLAALDELEADKAKEPKPLHARLADASPTLGGGA